MPAVHGMGWNEKNKVQNRVHRKPPFMQNIREIHIYPYLLDFLGILFKGFQEDGEADSKGQERHFFLLSF